MLTIHKLIKITFAFLCIGMAASLLILAGFGLDPVNVFVAGLANVFHTTVGIANLGFYFAIVAAVFFTDRHYISYATLISLIIVGPSIDVFTMVFRLVVTPDSQVAIRIVFFVIAYFSLTFGVALYLSLNLGVSAVDMVPVIVSEKAKLQFRWCKVAFDISVTLIGILLGGAFGAGTILLGIITGPTIQYFRKNLEKRAVQ